MVTFHCPHCNKPCKTKKGREQHITSSKLCLSAQNAIRLFQEDKTKATGKRKSGDDYSHLFKHLLEKDEAKRCKVREKTQTQEKQSTSKSTGTVSETRTEPELPGQDPHGDGGEAWFDPFAEASDYSGDPAMMDDDDDQEDDGSEETNQGQEEEIPFQASRKSVTDFKAYARNAFLNYTHLEDKEKVAVKLMRTLLKKKASLDTYQAVMEWHLIASGKLREGASLGNCQHYVSRKKLLKKLRKRYNMEQKYATAVKIVLPHTKTKVTVWTKQARDNVQSILTDPRHKDEDFLYFDDDPFAPPPEDLAYIGDFNTGEAYIETYKRLITKPNQILVGIPLYIDGAVTGQFDKLQITALKMTLGILNRTARDREYCWKTLGYVTNYAKEDSRGQKMFVDSGHMAAHEVYMDSSDDEGDVGGADKDVDKAGDYHAILSVLLESLRVLIAKGMMFDICYKGKVYKDCELVFFVPFVKCDGDEGDKLCGQYRSRSAKIAQLCRYCMCPNAKTDNPNAKFKYKCWEPIKKLVDEGNEDALQKLSQVNMKNAFHGLRFGLQNERGIHGGCPWELLHAILLGIFKYCRDCFFQQMGPTSGTAAEINALSKMMGILFTKQSDRNRPRTKFSKGILKGKLMAKEYTGVLLVMAAILRCKKGQLLLKKSRKKNFREEWLVRDWILLVETLLQWEAYLMSDQMDKNHVKRLEKKNRFVMFLLKKVGNRTKGMGFKVMKFHAITHLADDIRMFGVPMVVDTGSNESHHKTTKVAAKLTQKDIQTFEKQTSDRCDDFEVLELALHEIEGCPLWEYFTGYEHKDTVEKEQIDTIGGMMYHIWWDPSDESMCFDIQTQMRNKNNVQIDVQLLAYLKIVQDKLMDDKAIERLCVFSEHTRSGQIFRAHPNYRGKGAWRDWVMIQWQEGDIPAMIWGFLDISELPLGDPGKWMIIVSE